MLTRWSCCVALAAITMIGPAAPRATVETSEHQTFRPQRIEIPGTNYEIVLGPAETPSATAPTPSATAPHEAMLIAIESWLSHSFELPLIHDHPRIEFAPAAAIAALRYRGLLPTQSIPASRDILAVYANDLRTIFLPDTWVGSTPADLSVLVHEMAHHLQNLAGLKYECPQARERLAFTAQDRWLGLFGTGLEEEFGIDMFTVFVKSACMD